MGKIIGIDLGTTNSLVAVWQDGKCKLIPNALGEYLTPSVVSVDKDGTIYVGKIAKERLISHPKLTASLFKRDMGLRQKYKLGRSVFTPEELSSMVLWKLKEDAERYLGESVEEAIISVPAYFNDMGRNATKRAGRLAGLRVDRIVNEPSAAALACRYQQREEDATVLVFDFGGGTLDVSLVDCFDNVIEIMAVSGNNHLGGQDFDEKLAQHFLQQMGLERKQISDGAYRLILQNAEQCKRELSEEKSAHLCVSCPEVTGDIVVSRKEMLDICSELFEKIAVPVNDVLRAGQMSVENIDHIVLVGGSCKMKVVQQYLRYILNRDDVTVMNPDHIIALGVGVYAGIKEREEDIKDILLTDICPFSLGTNVVNRCDEKGGDSVMCFLIERNSPLPISREVELCTIWDGQERILVNVFQGENMYTRNNLCLGTLLLDVPPLPKGEVTVKVRFTYDINGVLDVETEVPLTQEKKRLVIVNQELGMSEEEINSRLKELEKWKMNPANDEENRYAMELGLRLFEQCSGALKSEIGYRIQYFEMIMNRDVHRVERARKHLLVFLAYVQGIMQQSELGAALQYRSDWYEDEEEEMEYEQWKEKD